MSQAGMRLGVSTFGGRLHWAVSGEAVALKASIAHDEARSADLAAQAVRLLARATRERRAAEQLRAELVAVGEELFRTLVPAAVRDALGTAAKIPLSLSLDESLLRLPWELLHDGAQFLCRRFDLSRVVTTAQVVRAPMRQLGNPLRMLAILADDGSLAAVEAEGQALLRAAEGRPGLTLRVRRDLGAVAVGRALKEHDLVHFAGHAVFDAAEPERSGWQLDGGAFTAADVAALTGGRPMPALVFSNACQSSRDAPWDGEATPRVYGLASAFLLAGVRVYVGTQWDVVDGHSEIFAGAFYRTLLDGRTVGAAMRKAREAIVVAGGEDALAWAAYVVYGDPAQVLCQPRPHAVGPPLPSPADLARRESLKASRRPGGGSHGSAGRGGEAPLIARSGVVHDAAHGRPTPAPLGRTTLRALRTRARTLSPLAMVGWVILAATLTAVTVVGLLRLLS